MGVLLLSLVCRRYRLNNLALGLTFPAEKEGEQNDSLSLVTPFSHPTLKWRWHAKHRTQMPLLPSELSLETSEGCSVKLPSACLTLYPVGLIHWPACTIGSGEKPTFGQRYSPRHRELHHHFYILWQ